MKNIEMMEELLKKSAELRKNHAKETAKDKKHMLLKAKKKIQDYFQDILKSCPLNNVFVRVNEEIEVMIKKDVSVKNEESHPNVFSKADVIFIELNPNHYTSGDRFALQDDFAKHRIDSHFYLYPLSEKAILTIIDHFDLIKQKTEETVMADIEKKIFENANSLKDESKKLEKLNEFLA